MNVYISLTMPFLAQEEKWSEMTVPPGPPTVALAPGQLKEPTDDKTAYYMHTAE